MFVPPNYNKTGGDHPLKKIMIPHGMAEAKIGPDIFFQQRCPVNTCTIVRDNPDNADLILFKDYVTHVGRRSYNQVNQIQRQAILIFANWENVAYTIDPQFYSYHAYVRTFIIFLMRILRFLAGVDAVFFRMSLSHAECEERSYQLDRHISTWQWYSGTLWEVAILWFQCHTDLTNV